ncbi:MAG: ribose 5-phosphate isomerase B [Coriobacteriia bacterium]|nr:ribose 5-phosphate isomerase B [Coriobacteriia bacterium]
MPVSKIAIASDHAGFEQKAEIAKWLENEGYEVFDFGPFNDDRVDYPDYAELVADAVVKAQAELGILICGTGIGMAIAANKIPGIRAATLTSTDVASLAREHNAANIATLSGRFVDLATNKQIVEAFINSEPLGERHAERVKKISALETRRPVG